MKYFGIKTPEKSFHQESYIWWIAASRHEAWSLFFTFPNSRGNLNSHRAPMDEAIRAYEAIGYRCVELEVTEK